jgi:hypothetical protein
MPSVRRTVQPRQKMRAQPRAVMATAAHWMESRTGTSKLSGPVGGFAERDDVPVRADHRWADSRISGGGGGGFLRRAHVGVPFLYLMDAV